MVEVQDEKMLKHYELLYIIPAKYTVNELPAVNDKIKAILSEYGCQITYEEDMGKKKLAYPIKQVYHGYYFVTEFNLNPDKLKGLDTSLRLFPDVLRHLVVIKKEKTAEEIAKEKERRARAEEVEVEQLKEKIDAERVVVPEKTDVEKSKKDDKRGKVSIEDLDKKLDELIDNTIL
ncbi:MAG: 30S ribosomal protein S6 [Patescibacteria group bacterium]|jgi:small subunit ribosomal protein S6